MLDSNDVVDGVVLVVTKRVLLSKKVTVSTPEVASEQAGIDVA